MKTPIVSLEKAIELLKAGYIGVIPTDTVYGIVARAHDETATTRLYAAKHREHKPGTLIANSVDQLLSLSVPASAIDLVKKWWPGALSAILPVEGHEYLHQDLGDLAMRIVADPKVRSILEQTGPLITSSANQPGKPGSTTIDEAIAYFGDSIDFYVDGGDLSGRAPSTIIKVTDDGSIAIIRSGAVELDV